MVSEKSQPQAAHLVALAEVFGCMVDEILGQQSVVLKNLDKQFKNLKFLRGTAILGDGHVGLVVDVKNLIAAAFDEAV